LYKPLIGHSILDYGMSNEYRMRNGDVENAGRENDVREIV